MIMIIIIIVIIILMIMIVTIIILLKMIMIMVIMIMIIQFIDMPLQREGGRGILPAGGGLFSGSGPEAIPNRAARRRDSRCATGQPACAVAASRRSSATLGRPSESIRNTYVYIYIYIYIYKCICNVYVCIYIYIYMHIYVYIYIYAW